MQVGVAGPMSDTNDTETVLALTCSDLELDPEVIEAQAVYLFGILMAFGAIAVGLDSLRTTPSRLIRNLLAIALFVNFLVAIMNWVAWIQPFTCDWTAFRSYDIYWMLVSSSQSYIIAILSICRALTVYDALNWRTTLPPAALMALIPATLNVIMEVLYSTQIVDMDSLINAQYDPTLSSVRYAVSYAIEAGSLLSIVGKILFVTYKQQAKHQQTFRTAWMLLSVMCRLATVILFYALGALTGSLLYTLAYSCADSVLLIMIAIDEVRFKTFFAETQKAESKPYATVAAKTVAHTAAETGGA